MRLAERRVTDMNSRPRLEYATIFARPSAGSGERLDQSQPRALLDELSHRALGHAGPRGQIDDARPLRDVDVAQHVQVHLAHVGEAGCVIALEDARFEGVE